MILLALALLGVPHISQGSVYSGDSLHVSGPASISGFTVAKAPLQDGTQLWGHPNNVSLTRTTVAWVEVDGEFEQISSGQTDVQANGLDVWESTTNYASDSLDATAWPTVGSPIVTADQASGPFAAYNSGAECDWVEDDDAAVQEAVRVGVVNGSTVGDFTVSAFVKYSNSADLGLRISAVGGSGGVNCSFSGLDDYSTATACVGGSITCRGGSPCDGTNGYGPNGDVVRLAYTLNTSGTPTSTIGYLYPAFDTASDEGGFYVCGGQFEYSSYATRPCLEEVGGASVTCNADVPTLATTAWPTTSGEVLVAFTPGDEGGHSRYLVDALSSSNGLSLYVGGGGGLNFVTGDGATPTLAGSSALTWTPGVTYRIRATWGAGALYVYRDGVEVASLTSGGDTPTAYPATASLCITAGGSNSCNGRLQNLRVLN